MGSGLEGQTFIIEKKNIKGGQIYIFLIFLQNYICFSDVFEKLRESAPAP
jgi:hypothetical protein